MIPDDLPLTFFHCELVLFVQGIDCCTWIHFFQEKYGIEPTMVVHGVKMLYVPVMPGHSKRLKLT